MPGDRRMIRPRRAAADSAWRERSPENTISGQVSATTILHQNVTTALPVKVTF
jgi:hypothetical protein